MEATPSSVHDLRRFVVRYQMVLFVLLTYLISWASVIPAEGSVIPHGPMIAAFIVLAAVAGRRGVSALWQQMTRWDVGWSWYLIAPAIIIAAHVCALLSGLASGVRIANTAHLQSPAAYLGVIVPLVVAGGHWEEPGWLGYTLRRLQERFPHPPLRALLQAGTIRMVWHTPLLVYGWIPWFDYLFAIFALQTCLTWLYNRTGRSVVIPMLCHLTSNVALATIRPLFDSTDQGQYWMRYTVAISAIALGILLATRGTLGLRLARPPAASPDSPAPPRDHGRTFPTRPYRASTPGLRPVHPRVGDTTATRACDRAGAHRG
jgi:hypothetical protein